MANAINSGKGSKHWPAGTKYWEDDSPTTKILRSEAIAKASKESLEYLGDLVTNFPGPLVEAATKKNGQTVLTEKQQQARRKSHLGGSDLAAVFGCSRFMSNLELYYKKIGKKPRIVEDDPIKEVILAYGHACEDVCAQAWQLRYPEWDIRSDETIYNHPRFPFLSANLDRVIRGEDGCWMVGEIKCPVVSEAEQMWWNDGKDLLDYQKMIVPLEYELQVRLYMAILGIWQARFAVMFSPTHIIYRRVVRDLDKEAAILKACDDFWNNHVLCEVPPDIINNEKNPLLALDAVKRFSPKPKDAAVRLPVSLENTAVSFMELTARKQKLAKEEDELKKQLAVLSVKIGTALGESTKGYIDCTDGSTVEIKFNPQNGRRSIDYNKLKEDYPDAYDACVSVPDEGPRPMKVKYL